MAETDQILQLATQIVSAYISHHDVARNDLPDLIKTVYRSLCEAQKMDLRTEEEKPVPAVAPEKSVFADHVLCLECGQAFKSLKRHLRSTHGLSAKAYLEKWDLPQDYPLVAPDYSKQRSHLAKRTGLGKS